MLEIKEYDMLGCLSNEEDAFESFQEYSGSTYICDAISEIVDGMIPIYNHEVWANAADIQEYIEDAISEGLVSASGSDIDLIRIFQAGYYQYYNQALYNNLNTLIYNYMAVLMSDKLSTMNEELFEYMDIGDIQERLEDEAEGFDNNSRFSALEDFVDDVFAEFEEEAEEAAAEDEEEEEEDEE